LCERKGVSCNKAAYEIGLSNATPTKWRKTGATPSGETLDKVALYFGVSTDYLLGKRYDSMMDLFAGNSNRSLTPLESAIIEQRQKNSPGNLETTERESKILEAFRTKTPAEQKAFLTLLGISED
jgi:transcriptional regulator with XRE-family HTH domain